MIKIYFKMGKILFIFLGNHIKAIITLRPQGFFSKFLMGGELKIFGPRQSPTGTKSDGGDL